MSYIVLSVFVLTLGLSEMCLMGNVPPIITAVEGESCVLPCTGLDGLELEALNWRNVDQKKDVLLCRGQTVLDGYEDAVYTNRTCLQDPEHLNRNLSLVLKKVMPKDSGIYQCKAEYTDEQTTLQFIRLSVTRVTTEVRNVTEVSAFVGEDCVLPFFTDKPLELSILEWTRTDSDRRLLVLKRRTVMEGYEDPQYKNRVDLVDPQLNSGNLSVTLNSVTLQDSATYRCQVYSYDSEEISQFVRLTVRERDSTKINTDPDPSPRLFCGVIFGMVFSCLLLLSVVLVVLIYLRRKKTSEISKHSESGKTPASNSKACPVLLVEDKSAPDKDEDPEFLGQGSCQRTHSNCSESSNSSEESTSSETALLPSYYEKKPSLDV